MKKISITLKDIEITVYGYYTKGEPQTYDYLGSDSEFEIEEVYIHDSYVNIIELLSSHFETIIEKCIEKIENNKNN